KAHKVLVKEMRKPHEESNVNDENRK
ncbi:DNA mismatch repair protein MutS, partial [Enterococcus faecium]